MSDNQSEINTKSSKSLAFLGAEIIPDSTTVLEVFRKSQNDRRFQQLSAETSDGLSELNTKNLRQIALVGVEIILSPEGSQKDLQDPSETSSTLTNISKTV